MAKKTTLTFGKKRQKESSKNPSVTSAADLALLCGVITAAVFFLGSLSPTVEDTVHAPLTAIPVMSGAVEVSSSADDVPEIRERLRENIRNASGEPFGYMNGRWNLWEYLGDVMASLLLGG